MTSLRRRVLFLSPLLALSLIAAPRTDQASAVVHQLAPLSNAEFWRLATDLSEPDGTFHSENLVSNEARFQSVIPGLLARTVPGRAYVGVGSEQNFSYIAAVKPSHVFILDIRRGNLDLHLLYKAFFELSADRAEFVSRVFSRPKPVGLTAASSVDAIFTAFAGVAPSRALYDRNLAAAVAHLTRTRGFGLSDGDREGMAYVLNAWYESGPDISYQLTGGGGGRGRGGTSYAFLMTTTDGAGEQRSYLASDESFRFLKALHTRNRIVPIVGNFGGPKALRAVASYLRQQRMIVSAFYASNVQQYLVQSGTWNTFCASASTLPMDDRSTMISSERGGFSGAAPVPGGGFRVELLPLREALSNGSAR